MIQRLMTVCVVLAFANSSFAGPRVDIVIGEKAPALERLAADELASQLKRVYDADVKIAATAPPDSPHVLFVGSPDTNASMKPFADSWPNGDKKLTDQGHLLRSVTHNNKPALLIGGGSPVATYWAVAEFGHRLGIRSMLFGDLDPVSPPEFALDGIDILKKPTQQERGWLFLNQGPTDCGSWGLDEYRHAMRQLAKLKFNRVTVEIDVGAPFVHFEYSGVKRQSESLWERQQFRVSGDTAGRKAFGGTKFFEHPSFVGATTYEDRIAAGAKLLTEIINAAHEVGLSISFQFDVAAFPPEFVKFTTGYSGSRLDPPTVSGIDLEDQKTTNLARAQTQAYLETYPTLDGVELQWDLIQSDVSPLRRLFVDPAIWKRPNGRKWEVRTEYFRDESGFRVTAPFLDQGQNVDAVAGAAVIQLYHHRHYVLPRLHGDLLEQLNNAKQLAPDGFRVTAAGFSDLDLPAYWLSRSSFGDFEDSVALDEACESMLEPVCGKGVADCVLKGMSQIQRASGLMDRWLWLGDDFSSRGHFTRLGSVNDAQAQSWASARDHYLNAMNEFYRANTRARDGSRVFTLYWARRCEFAFEYMNCIEAVRKAGVAERKQDTATQIAELEKAIESLNNALNAMAAVARSNSDRGLIAVLNEYGYRPLKKKLAEAEK